MPTRPRSRWSCSSSSFVIIFAVNRLQRWAQSRIRRAEGGSMTMQIADSGSLPSTDARHARTPPARDSLRTEPPRCASPSSRWRCCSSRLRRAAAGRGVRAGASRRAFVAYLAALADPDALAAIRLTLLVAAISVGLNLVFGLVAAWAIAKFEFPRQDLPDHADRPAVLGEPGDLGPRLRAAVRRAGLFRPLAAGITTSRSCSRCPASCWRPSS